MLFLRFEKGEALAFFLRVQAIVPSSGGGNSRQFVVWEFSGYYLNFKAIVPSSGGGNSRQFLFGSFEATI